MFGKSKVCCRCGKKCSKKDNFCPNCGFNFKNEELFQPSFNLGFPFNTLLKQLSKEIEQSFKELDKGMEPTFDDDRPRKTTIEPKMHGISISISSSGEGNPIIKVRNLGHNKEKKPDNRPEQIQKAPKLTDEQRERLSKLPKEEPSTSVRRLTDRIVYEIDLPGVEEKNIIITRLQNSIEIKAFTKEKAFFKLIPISLPILKSKLEEGKLIIELKPAQ